MLTTTERLGRTRIRVSADPDGGRCQVRTAISGSDATVSLVRPVVLHHDHLAARVSLVPEGALLLAGDAIEVDVTVDAGARLDIVEPGGTVAFDMRDRSARWDVRIRLGTDAALTWAGQPFVVSAGAEVTRRLHVDIASGATLALRETLVLGRYGEGLGRLRQHTAATVGGLPALVEDLPLDALSAPGLLGGRRVVSSVLLLGSDLGELPESPLHRYDLEHGGHLWRRLGAHAHEAGLPDAWAAAVGAVG